MSHGGRDTQSKGLAAATNSRKASTVVIEDHPGYAEIIRIALERSGYFEVVGTATTPKEAIALVVDKRPEVALIDVRLPSGSEGIEVAAETKRHSPTTTVVMLTGSDDSQYVRDVMPVRVEGYLSKNISTEHLAPAVLCACAGLRVLSKSAMEAVLEESKVVPCPLPEDKLLVLKLAATDLPVKDIAATVLGSRSKVYRAFTAIQNELVRRRETFAV